MNGEYDRSQAMYGLTDAQRVQAVTILQTLLGMEYTLQIKTQNYHWNVTGMSFGSLHLLFEQQYGSIAGFVDRIAEQIRKYGERTPGSMGEFAAWNGDAIKETAGYLTAPEMISDLASDHDTIANFINEFSALGGIDLATENLLGDVLDFHMKSVWVLRSHLM